MATLDLNKKREERKKARVAANENKPEQPKRVKLNDLTVTLPQELPARFAMALADRDLEEAIAILFGEKAATFWEQEPSMDDVNALAEGVTELYGVAVGESSPSATSS